MSKGAWPFWRAIPRFESEYGFADLIRAGRALVAETDSIEPEFSRLFPAAPFYFVRSGRESLYLILKILGLRAGSRVGVPLYCCMAVFQAIAAAGHVPVFLDIDLNDYSLDQAFLRKNKDKIDALVVVHTFGYPANMDLLRDALAGRNVPVIEDCAHSLLAEYKGGLTGTLTDASFFSFAPHKPAAVGGGGLLVINNPEFAKAAKREVENLVSERSWEEIRHSLTCLARGFVYQRQAYGALMASPLRRLRDQDQGNPTEEDFASIHQPWSPKRIRRVDLPLVAHRIREFRGKLPALAGNAQRLRDHLRGAALVTPQEPPYGRWNHHMVPIRYPSAESRESGRRFLMNRGVDTSPLFQNCARNAGWFGYEGGCPQAELAAKTVCAAPNHASLSAEEIAYVGESLRLSAEAEPPHEAAALLARDSSYSNRGSARVV